MRVIIHCGTHKTGTTAIQNTAWCNRDRLVSQYGVLYPSSVVVSGKKQATGRRHAPLAYGASQVKYQDILRKLEAEIERAKPSAVIISSEAFSRPDCQKNLRSLVEGLVNGHRLGPTCGH